MSDNVNPGYYKTGGLEAIDVIEAFFMHSPHLANCFKYLARMGKKPGNSLQQDAEKAKWYLDRWVQLETRRQCMATHPSNTGKEANPQAQEEQGARHMVRAKGHIVRKLSKHGEFKIGDLKQTAKSDIREAVGVVVIDWIKYGIVKVSGRPGSAYIMPGPLWGEVAEKYGRESGGDSALGLATLTGKEEEES